MMTGVTFEEMADSLTGYEEIAIEQQFGTDLQGLAEKGTTLMRSFVFVLLKREGKKDPEAKAEVMNMSLRQIRGYFEDEVEEVMPDQPFQPAGKAAQS